MPDVNSPPFANLQDAVAALKAGIQKHNLGVYAIGVAYNFIVANKTWQGTGYANATDLLNKEAKPALAPSTASRYGRIAATFPEATCLKYDPQALYDLVQYAHVAHLGSLPADPGDVQLPVTTKAGVVQKAFKDASTREVVAAIHAAEAGDQPADVQSEVTATNTALATLPGHKGSHSMAQGKGDSLTYSIVGLTPEEHTALRACIQKT